MEDLRILAGRDDLERRKQMINEALELLEKLPGARVLCLGDLMLDRYIYGEAHRLSPEAPVPVILVRKKDYMPGGLGNVVMNLSALAVPVMAVGLVGSDHEGKLLIDLLTPSLSGPSGLIEDSQRPTTVKTRIIAGIQQVARVDEESVKNLSPKISAIYQKNVEKTIDRAKALAVSDYGKGVLDPEMIGWIIKLATKKNIPVVVDPKGSDYSRYAGATLVTPNRQELSLAVGQDLIHASSESLTEAGLGLMKKHSILNLLITRSEDGMTLIKADGRSLDLPARAREVFDVSGAGDTVVAVMAAALAAGSNLAIGAELAGLAAGVVVGKVGTAPATPDEIRNSIEKL